MELFGLDFYQVVVTVVAAVMLIGGIGRYLLHFSRGSILKILVRIVVWGGIMTFALQPNLADSVADFMGIKDNVSALIVIGFILVFLMIFKILSIIERIERDISTLTRKDALDK